VDHECGHLNRPHHDAGQLAGLVFVFVSVNLAKFIAFPVLGPGVRNASLLGHPALTLDIGVYSGECVGAIDMLDNVWEWTTGPFLLTGKND
jgi:hypothetical protein